MSEPAPVKLPPLTTALELTVAEPLACTLSVPPDIVQPEPSEAEPPLATVVVPPLKVRDVPDTVHTPALGTVPVTEAVAAEVDVRVPRRLLEPAIVTDAPPVEITAVFAPEYEVIWKGLEPVTNTVPATLEREAMVILLDAKKVVVRPAGGPLMVVEVIEAPAFT